MLHGLQVNFQPSDRSPAHFLSFYSDPKIFVRKRDISAKQKKPQTLFDKQTISFYDLLHRTLFLQCFPGKHA